MLLSTDSIQLPVLPLSCKAQSARESLYSTTQDDALVGYAALEDLGLLNTLHSLRLHQCNLTYIDPTSFVCESNAITHMYGGLQGDDNYHRTEVSSHYPEHSKEAGECIDSTKLFRQPPLLASIAVLSCHHRYQPSTIRGQMTLQAIKLFEPLLHPFGKEKQTANFTAAMALWPLGRQSVSSAIWIEHRSDIHRRFTPVRG